MDVDDDHGIRALGNGRAHPPVDRESPLEGEFVLINGGAHDLGLRSRVVAGRNLVGDGGLAID